MIAALLYGNDMPTTASLFDKAVDVMANRDHDEDSLREVATGLLNAFVALSDIHGDSIEFVEAEPEKLEVYQKAYLKGYGFETDTEDVWLPDTVPAGPVPKRAIKMLGEVHGGRDRQRLRAIQSEMKRAEERRAV